MEIVVTLEEGHISVKRLFVTIGAISAICRGKEGKN